MKRRRGVNRGVNRGFNCGIVGSLVLLSACGAQNNKGPAGTVETAPAPVMGRADPSALAAIGESTPVESQAVWLEKKYWLGRKIWLSVGVERSSVTGLAMTVTGYIPAQVERAGSDLVLKRQARGDFGGTVLEPEFPINTYPILSETADRILVDVAHPGSPYGLTSIGQYGDDDASTELQPRFEYVKKVETTASSVSFHSVVTVKSAKPLFEKSAQSAEARAQLDPYLLSLSLRTDWLVELESPNFAAVPFQEGMFGFFTTRPRVVSDGQDSESFLLKINPERKYRWELSANTPVEYQDSLRQGLLAWNEALGKEVFTVGVADGTRSQTDPSVSNVLWDDNQAIGYAFANWRSNPFTGEILQAQIYLSGKMWAENAKLTFKLRELEKAIRKNMRGVDDLPGNDRPAPILAQGRRAALESSLDQVQDELKDLLNQTRGVNSTEPRQLFFGLSPEMAREKARSGQYCFRSLPLAGLQEKARALKSVLEASTAPSATQPTTQPTTQPSTRPTTQPATQPVVAEPEDEHLPYPAEGETLESFSQHVLRAVVMHEAGHTIGLRHNFKGSLGTSFGGKVQSASIMDYNDLMIDASFERPGDGDQALIDLVYKGDKSVTPPVFCTDEQARLNAPDCSPFDFGQDPVRSARTQEETSLLLALHMFSMGQGGVGVNLMLQGLSEMRPMVNVALAVAPKPGLLRFIGNDQGLAARQEAAWKQVLESQDMLGLEAYPAPLRNLYSQMVVIVLSSSTSPAAAKSGIFDKLVDFYKAAVVAPSSTILLGTRLAAVTGLHNLQDLKARQALKEAAQALESRAKDASVEAALRAQDEEVLVVLGKVFREGYFKATSEAKP